MKSNGNGELSVMSGSPGTSSQLGIDAAASSFFVLTLDIPLNVVFRAAEPLTPLCRSTPPSDVAPINSPASRSPTSVAKRRVDDRAVTRKKRRVRQCDVMSRDHTPEVVRRAVKERSCAAGQSRQITAKHLMSGPAGRHEVLSRPRSRSVCGGKYCSVSALRPVERITPTVCPSGRLRPSSAVTTRHLPASNISPHHHPSTAATSVLRVARPSCHDDVNDDDTTTTSSSALGDSGVTSLVNGDVIRSRDSSPWSDRSGVGTWRGEGMTDTDRQSQLRRFLDAVGSTSEENHHRRNQSDDDDDDDVSDSETGRTSVNDLTEWQVGEDGQSGSAMDRVRHLVDRCRLPVNTCSHLSVDKPRLVTSTYASSMTSESIQRAILKATADLVKLSRADERVAQQLLTLSRRIQSYKLQLYSQLHRAVIDSAAVDLDDVQPSYVDLDIDRPELLATHLLRCGITRSHLQRRRRFSIF